MNLINKSVFLFLFDVDLIKKIYPIKFNPLHMSTAKQLKSSFTNKNPQSPTTNSSNKKRVSFNIQDDTKPIVDSSKTNQTTKTTETETINIKEKPKLEKTKSVPPSAYEIFSFENSESIIKENPNVPPEDFRELLATSWNELTKNEKEIYQKRSLNLWKKHDKKVKQLKQKVEDYPLSGYKLFVKEKKKDFKDLKQRDFRIKCGESWNELSIEEQEIYLKKSLELWKQHDKNVKECEFEFY